MNASPKALVILLHGVGSNGHDMMQLGNIWRAALPNVVFSAPDAPQGSGFGGGFQWFSIAGVTQENRPARIQAGRAAFDALISSIAQTHGFTDKLDKVVFVGFSQGSMMLLDAVASGRWPVAGGVAFSGRLASVPPLQPTSTKLLLIHGDADPVVPVQDGIAAAKTLTIAGMDVTSYIEPRLGHTISSQGAALALDFIKTTLA